MEQSAWVTWVSRAYAYMVELGHWHDENALARLYEHQQSLHEAK